MRITFIPPSAEEFLILLASDEGKLNKKGGGLGDISVYVPTSRSSRGSGLLSLLGGIARKSIPFLMRTFLPEGLDLARNVLSDVNSGKQFRQSLKSRGYHSLGNVGKRIVRGGSRKRKRAVKKKEFPRN